MIPKTPQAFLERFFPRQFEEHRAFLGAGESSSAATFVVEGEGVWTLHVEHGRLVVTAGRRDDTRLQVVFSREDFEAVVMRRAREELGRLGRISEASLAPFRVLFALGTRSSPLEREPGSLLFLIADGEVRRRMHVVPGAGEPPSRARTVLHLSLEDLLLLLGGRARGPWLFLTRRLRISGDLSYALRASRLLG